MKFKDLIELKQCPSCNHQFVSGLDDNHSWCRCGMIDLSTVYKDIIIRTSINNSFHINEFLFNINKVTLLNRRIHLDINYDDFVTIESLIDHLKFLETSVRLFS